MPDDFKIKLKADLDTKEAEKKIDDLSKNKKVKLSVDAGEINKGVKELESNIKTAQKSTSSFGDTLKGAFNIGSAAAVVTKGFQAIRTAAKDAQVAIKDFDQSIANIRTVMGNSYSDASRMVTEYNAMGKAMGATTKEIADAGVTWLRQGKSAQEANELIKQSTMLSKIGFLDSASAANYLTSALNGYKLAAKDACDVVDRLAVLDSSAAITAGGLAEAMSKTAVTAENAGISMDKLLGYLSVVGETTQGSMSSIGTAFKSIFARMSAIKADKLALVDEDGTEELLSDVELTLANVGIDLRKTVNEFDNFGSVLDKLAAKWDSLSSVQQAALAKAFAGTRNQEYFRILMTNYDKASKYADLSADSAGKAEQKYAAYLDSIEAKTKTLQAAFESLAVNTFSSESFAGIVEASTALVEFLDKTNLVKSALSGLAFAGVVGAFTSLTAGVVDATVRFNQFNAALSLLKAGNVGTSTLEKLSALSLNLSNSQLKAVLSSKALSTQQRITILTTRGMSEAEAKAALSTMGLATAEGTATTATGALSGAFKSLWATLMANPLVAIALAIGGTVAAVTTYNKKVQEMREESIKTGEAAQQQTEDIVKLKETYDKANTAYKNNEGTKEALTEATDDLLRALGLERSEIEKLAGVYGGLDEAIQKVTIDALKGKRIDLVKAYTSAEESLITSRKNKGITADYKIDDDSQRLLERLQERGLLTDAEKYGKRIFFDLKGDSESVSGLFEMEKDALRIKEELQEIAKNIGWDTERLINTNIWKSLEEIYSADLADIIDTAENAKNAINENIASIAFLSGDFTIPKTAEDFYNLRDALISATEADADFVGNHADAMKAVDATLELFSFTPQYASGYEQFKHNLKKLSDEAIKALTTPGTTPTEAIIKELNTWVNDTGLTKPEFTNYFKRLSEELSNTGEVLKESASAPIGNLVSLRDELVGTIIALENYKNAMKDGGEKGDLAKEYADAWQLAIENINAGRVDSNAVKQAANLFFSDEQLAAMGYDLEKVGKALNSQLMQAIFAPDEDAEEQLDYGVKLANYIRDNANLFEGVAGVSTSSNGAFQFWYKSIEDLARVLNLDTDAVGALLDALDAFGVEAMRSTDENSELIQKFYSIKAAAGESGDAVRDFIKALALDGADNFTISQIITDLQSWGIITDDVSNLGNLINEVRENLGDLSEEEPEPTANLNTDPAYTALNDIDAALTEWANSVYEATATVNYVEGEKPDTSSSQGHVKPGTRTPGYSIGTKNAPGGDVLLNEKGPELVSDNGEAYIANGGKPGFAHVGKGAVIFNAEETKEIFDHTNKNIPVKAFANGTPETVNKSTIRERLLNGKRSNAYASGYYYHNCANCGKQISSADNPCPKCGKDPWTKETVVQPQQTQQTQPNYKTCPNCGAWCSLGTTVCGQCGYNFNTGSMDNDYYIPYVPADDYTYDPTPTNGGYYYHNCANCGRQISSADDPCPYCGKDPWNANPVTPYQTITPPKQKTKNSNVTQPHSSSGYVGGGGGSSVGGADYASEAEPQKVDWISVFINRIEKAVAALEKIASSGFKRLSTRITAATDEIGELTKQIDANEQAYTRYMKEADSIGLDSSIAELVKNGTIDIREYDDETRKLIDSYTEWYEKAIDAKYAVEELHQEIADLYQDMFVMTHTNYSNELSLIEHDVTMISKNIDLAKTRGYLDSAEYYKQLMQTENVRIVTLQNELADLNSAFQNAIDSGEIEEGSESFYSMKLSILGVEEALADANIQLEEYAKTMRSIQWSYFDYALDQFGQLTKESDFLISLMSNDKLFDDMGKFAEKGTATMGLHVLNYNAAMVQADEYANEIRKIQEELNKNPYDTELIERRRLLIELQQQSIQAAENEKNAIRDLVSQGIQLEISALKELITKYEDSLSSAKDLYDYQKRISEKTGDIAKIEKQLVAYQNDTSEENRARVQKLREQLKNAQEDLTETEWQQSIADQKKLLNDFAEDYEEFLNTRLDDLEALVQEMVDGANLNVDEISETISAAADQVGYTLTDGISTVLQSGVYAYYDKMFNGITSISGYLNSINSFVKEMVANADSIAKASNATTSNGRSSISNTQSYNFSGEKIQQEISENQVKFINKSFGQDPLIMDYSEYAAKVKSGKLADELLSWIVNGTAMDNGLLLERLFDYVDVSNMLEAIRKANFKTPYGFSEGGLADYTGLAMLHGTKQKPELVLNSGDTENILSAARLMQTPILSALSDKSSFSRLFDIGMAQSGGDMNIGDIIINIEHVQDYNDFVTQLRDDPKFEKMISAMTFDRMNGKSSFGGKNRIQW